MSDGGFVDTNILVYAHDPSSGEKHVRASHLIKQLWDSGSGVLSTQALQELCVNLQRKCSVPLSKEEIRGIVHDYGAWPMVTNSLDSVLQALDLQIQYRVSFWDAMILQAAESAACDTLYSEDFANDRMYGSVRVINPLA